MSNCLLTIVLTGTAHINIFFFFFDDTPVNIASFKAVVS